MNLASGTVFVLGAGASVPYGLPSGASLRDDIIKLALDPAYDALAQIVIDAADANRVQLQGMARQLRDACVGSIDEWVPSNQWATKLAKCAIAAILLGREHSAPLHPDRAMFDQRYDWLGYFLQHVFASKAGLAGTKIVTFNFDRIVEHRLLRAIKGRTPGSEEEVLAKVAQLEIVHVSGILGQPEWSGAHQRDQVAFGQAPSQHTVVTAQKQIFFVHEERAEEPFARAQELIRNAPLVAFVGFGFNPQNVLPLKVRGAAQKTVFIGSAHLLDTAEARGIETHFKRVIRLYDRDNLGFLKHAPNLHRTKLKQPAPGNWEDYEAAGYDLIKARNKPDAVS